MMKSFSVESKVNVILAPKLNPFLISFEFRFVIPIFYYRIGTNVSHLFTGYQRQIIWVQSSLLTSCSARLILWPRIPSSHNLPKSSNELFLSDCSRL
jgi:hypothetical protein